MRPGTPVTAVAGPRSNPLTVATASGTIPCGSGPGGPYVAPPLLNFFRLSGVNISLAPFLTSQGAGQCVALAGQIAAASGLGVGVPVPFGDMTPNRTSGTSNYNGLSVNLRKRFTQRYEFLASYTWAHAIDDSTDVVSNSDAPQNNFSPNAERSNSTFDQRHRFVLSGVYNSGRVAARGSLGSAAFVLHHGRTDHRASVGTSVQHSHGRRHELRLRSADRQAERSLPDERSYRVAALRRWRRSTRRRERSTCRATSMSPRMRGPAAAIMPATWAAMSARSLTWCSRICVSRVRSRFAEIPAGDGGRLQPDQQEQHAGCESSVHGSRHADGVVRSATVPVRSASFFLARSRR